MKEKLDKLNFTKTENFCFVEDTVKRMKSQAIEKVFAKYLSDKDWYSKYISRLVTKDINTVNKQMK